MRARLAIASSGIQVEIREILLRDKAQEFLDASPKATVPVLITDRVIDESLHIMHWALDRADPEGLKSAMPSEGSALIEETDGPFKAALDHTKYAVRFPELNPDESRAKAAAFITKLDGYIADKPWLFGTRPSLADLAILPFVRQFAHTDLDWWDAQSFVHAQGWLDRFKASDRFAAVMTKYPVWKSGDPVTTFP